MSRDSAVTTHVLDTARGVPAARREFKAARLADYIRETVESALALTESQLARLRGLLA